jgi:hypothetical protein
MYNNIRYCIIDDVTYPIIEGVEGFNKRYVLFKSIANICNWSGNKIKSIKDSIKKNSDNFRLGDNIINIRDYTANDDKIFSKLFLTKPESKANEIYIIDEIGCKQLLKKVRKNSYLSDKILKFYDNDLVLHKSSAEQFKYMYSSRELNEITKDLELNAYIKIIKKSLSVPQKYKKALLYRKNVINPFKENYRKEALKYLCDSLEIDDIESIQRINQMCASNLLKNSYVLSEKLKVEYKEVLRNVNKLKEEYFENIENKNKKNHEKIISDIV